MRFPFRHGGHTVFCSINRVELRAGNEQPRVAQVTGCRRWGVILWTRHLLIWFGLSWFGCLSGIASGWVPPSALAKIIARQSSPPITTTGARPHRTASPIVCGKPRFAACAPNVRTDARPIDTGSPRGCGVGQNDHPTETTRPFGLEINQTGFFQPACMLRLALPFRLTQTGSLCHWPSSRSRKSNAPPTPSR